MRSAPDFPSPLRGGWPVGPGGVSLTVLRVIFGIVVVEVIPPAALRTFPSPRGGGKT
jgi:hypothetical protein